MKCGRYNYYKKPVLIVYMPRLLIAMFYTHQGNQYEYHRLNIMCEMVSMCKNMFGTQSIHNKMVLMHFL